MTRRRLGFWAAGVVGLAWILLVVPVTTVNGQDPSSDSESTHPLDRIAVIGASASSGWGVVLRYVDEQDMVTTQTASMRDVIEEVIQVDDATITGTGSSVFFMNPLPIGKQQINMSQAFQPTLVIALDYLFWYGYGNRDAEGHAIPRGDQGQAARLALLEQGLENLNTFSCPVVVGDFPDVSDAIGYMLSASQVPSPTTLKALNDRVKAWASARPNVTVIEMSTLLQDMRSDQVFKAGRQQFPKGAKSRFMQRDNLHPTLEGLIVLVQETSDHLATGSDEIDHAQFDFKLEAVRDRLYESRKPEGLTSKPYTGTN
ncbi:MAG: hypothetical protein VX527_07825 [Planctomycetota bacterium]|nr:hypothetical protein [Planctomycetota bacterium]